MRDNIKSDEKIALLLDRNEYLLISILGILKSGAAYVPIDPNYPEERISFILEDTQTKVVITNEVYQERIKKILYEISEGQIKNELIKNNINENIVFKNNSNSSELTEVMSIDSNDIQSKLQIEKIENLPLNNTYRNLSYIIYTSGTTGKPKGVMIEHYGVINHIVSLTHEYSISENENIMLFSNYVFDASVEQIFLALCNGGRLILMDNNSIQDQDKFVEISNKQKVTHIHATPGYLQMLNIEQLPKLNRIISGGDYLSPEFYNRLNPHIA